MNEKIWAENIEKTVAGWRAIETPKEWTAAELAKLRNMYNAGSRLKAIAAAVGRSLRAVDNKLVRIGLRPRTGRSIDQIIWTPEQIAELRKLCADARLSAADIAAQIGTTRNAVIGKSNRLGIIRLKKPPSKPKHRPAARIRAIHQALETPSSRLMPEDRWILDEAEPFVTPSSAPKARHVQGNKTFYELSPRDCRFPLGDAKTPATLFCGKQALSGKPYCEQHCRVTGTARRRNGV